MRIYNGAMRKLAISFVMSLLLMPFTGIADTADAMFAAADLIRNYPDPSVIVDSVDVDDGVIKIRGKADANSDISAMMRFLQKEVGSVNLESVSRVDNVSSFYLTIKKLNQQ